MTDTQPTSPSISPEQTPGSPEVMIRLDSLTKRYSGQGVPAVDNVTMDIPEGEIVVFVGPSGCGKTTLLKLINRIIEPTSGSIFLQGENVTSVNPDQLRRRIGYVIQQIGLFPHQTIAQNIATVPRLLGWNKQRIAERVDELLQMVRMDPDEFRSRYPKELSGGQNQRVGVARALGGDPQVMLMDEPFGAIDPITRERLQNEFLRLQADVRKTICFVTHDIDEAIKIGDRIAILQDQSHIAQYDQPEVILTAPANEFVEDFIGSGAALKRLNLTRIRDVELDQWAWAGADEERATIRRKLADSEHGSLLILDDQHRPRRWVNARDLARDTAPVGSVGLPATALVEPHATLHDALDEMVTSRVGCAIVIDERGKYQGVVDMATIMRAVEEMRAAARAQSRQAAAVTSGADSAPVGAGTTDRHTTAGRDPGDAETDPAVTGDG
jgi:osmoprotectant transport system ATP-binding protein